MMGALISIAEVKRKQMIAMYVKFYGTTYDSTRK
ncbi:hypothetical protein J2Y67_004089 [Neobacillus niacini]|nr:hypothetical protein [Neobacillus niacini]